MNKTLKIAAVAAAIAMAGCSAQDPALDFSTQEKTRESLNAVEKAYGEEAKARARGYLAVLFGRELEDDELYEAMVSGNYKAAKAKLGDLSESLDEITYPELKEMAHEDYEKYRKVVLKDAREKLEEFEQGKRQAEKAQEVKSNIEIRGAKVEAVDANPDSVSLSRFEAEITNSTDMDLTHLDLVLSLDGENKPLRLYLKDDGLSSGQAQSIVQRINPLTKLSESVGEVGQKDLSSGDISIVRAYAKEHGKMDLAKTWSEKAQENLEHLETLTELYDH